MIEFAQARALAESVVAGFAAGQRPPGQRVVIVDENTIEDQLGWIFFTQAEKFLRTGKFRDRLIGNGPIFVDRAEGSMVDVPTYQSAATFLADYRQWRSANPPRA